MKPNYGTVTTQIPYKLIFQKSILFMHSAHVVGKIINFPLSAYFFQDSLEWSLKISILNFTGRNIGENSSAGIQQF